MQVEFLISAFRESQFPAPDRSEIAFAGRSNVGKSSLINVLANRKNMARTSATPGRTQAINYFSIDNSFYMVDLPGYGFAKVPVSVKKSWGKMVETYLRTRPNLKAVVVILDIRREPGSGDMDLLNWLRHFNIQAVLVLTKADKLSRQQVLKKAGHIKHKLDGIGVCVSPILFSAKTRQGRERLWDTINEICGD